MDEARFWGIVDEACGKAPDVQEWDARLADALRRLPPGEIIEWDRIFGRLMARAYTNDLWGAAYLINGGASDDGFYYFRCWLIGLGRDAYEAAVADPDSLADVVDPGDGDLHEAETYGAARQAWMDVAGADEDDAYPEPREPEDLVGDDWDFDDDAEVRRRLPHLAAMYLEG